MLFLMRFNHNRQNVLLPFRRWDYFLLKLISAEELVFQAQMNLV